MPKNIELTEKKQQREIAKNPDGVVEGNMLSYNAAGKAKYQARIDKLIDKMIKETNRELEKLFKSQAADDYFDTEDASISSQARILMDKLTRKFEALFDDQAKPITEQMIRNENNASKANTKASFERLSGGATINTDFMTAGMSEVVKASAAESTSLIKSIPQQHMEAVEGAVMRSITTGNGLEDLVPFLEKRTGITKRRARFIAKDQTKKVYSNLNAKRMTAVGLDKYRWQHSGADKVPRPHHVKSHESGGLNGGIFSLSNPPIIDPKTGQRGKPGDLPGCTCIMVPVMQLDDGENADA